MKQPFELSFGNAESVDVDIDASGLGRVVVPVAIARDFAFRSFLGTAFCVAQLPYGDAIFVTAKHVIADLSNRPDVDAYIILPDGPAAADGRRNLRGIIISQVVYAEKYSDLALLVANPKQYAPDWNNNVMRLPVTFGPPQVGQYCLALGYGQQQDFQDYKMTASRGLIEEIYPRRFVFPFPNLRAAAQSRHGMSGGPILDMRGRVIGAISAGSAPGDEYVHVYGASIASLIEMKLELNDDNGNPQEVSLVQLADMGLLGDPADPAIDLVRTDDHVTLSWSPPIES